MWPHELQHTRLPCPSPSLRVCSNSCPLSLWCHPTISSFVVPFSSCPQSLTASCSFWMSQLFTSGGPSIGAGASASSISPSSEYLGLISFSIDFDLLAFQITLKSLLQQHNSKASILLHSAFFMVQLLHPYMTTEKTVALTIQTFVGKVMSLLLNMLSRFVIAFLARSKHLIISWLQSPSAVIFEPKKRKCHCFYFFPSICHEVMGPDAIILVFWTLSLSQLFHSPFSLSSRGSLVPLCFLPWRQCNLHISDITLWYYWYCYLQTWFQLVRHPVWHFTWCAVHII